VADTSLLFNIIGRDRTGPAFRSAADGASKLGGRMKAGLAAGAAALGGATLAVGAFAAKSIQEARESAKVTRLTENVIRSTGKAANVTSKQVSDLSTAISNKTGVDDEAIQSGQNLLLTFTGIRNEAGKGNDIFNQASQAITDMAAGLNNGEVSASTLKTSSIQLGKALNDPIKGITALSKSGVSFTEQQKAQIKEMVKSGDTMGAQKVILGELKKEFGGAAAAAADPAKKAQVAWSNLQEQLGAQLLPVFNRVVGLLVDKVIPAVSNFISNVQSGGGKFAQFRAALTAIGSAVRRLAGWFRDEALPVIRNFVQKLWADLQPAIQQVAASFRNDIIPAVKQFADKFREAWPTIKRVLNILGEVASFILRRVVPVLIKFYGKYLSTLIRVFGHVFSAGWKIIGVLLDLGGALIKAGKKFWAFAVAVKDAFVRAKNFVTGGVDKIVGFLSGMPGRISRATSGMFDGIKNAFRSAINFVIGGWNRLRFGVPEINTHIPGVGTVGGGSFGVPQIPYLAKGGNIIRDGLAIVGEQGPELVNLNRGAQVTPLPRQASKGGGQTIRVEFDFGSHGVEGPFVEAIRKAVRVRGGNVQVVFGK
jgi:hypothetical protein